MLPFGILHIFQRSIIWREVPLKGRSPSTEEFLELARKRRTLLYIDDVKGEVDKALLEEEQMLHDENSSAPPRRSLPVFEDKAWFGALMVSEGNRMGVLLVTSSSRVG